MIQKIITKNRQKQALKYLHERMKIATIKNLPLQYVFDNVEKGLAYYYSSFLILCLKPTDMLVRGAICKSKKEGKELEPDFDHGWVEFEYNGEWWVFDDHYNLPVPIKDWYKKAQPCRVDIKLSQQNMLSYMNETYGEEKISSTEVWDRTHRICLPYVQMETNSADEITKIVIDKDNKFFVRNPLEACVTDWA